MFDRFTDRACQVMSLARRAAEDSGRHYIGTEHILLGLACAEGCVSSVVLRGLGLSETAILDAIQRTLADSPIKNSLGQLPFTPRVKLLLEQSSEIAANLGHNYIGTEHLLLGLAAGQNAATDVLKSLGVDLNVLRRAVLAKIDPSAGVKEPDHVLEADAASNRADIVHAEADLSFDSYQEFTVSTAIYPGSESGGFDAMTYVALKLCGESGEFAQKLGKCIRKGKSIGAITRAAMSEEFKLELAKELGDVLWYVSQAATELGYDLQDIARINVAKLTSRQDRGVLDGCGDDR